MSKHCLVNALLSVCSLGVGLILAEALARVAVPQFDPSHQVALSYSVGNLNLGQPGTRSRQAKNTGDFDVSISINEYGLRDDKNIAFARAEDLIVVGDSFAWGWGVEASERFSDLVQTRTGIATFNLATPTDLKGDAALLEYAEHLGARIGRVILAVCMENDLRLYGEGSATFPPDGSSILDELKARLASTSTAYAFALTVIHQTPTLRALAERLGLIVPNLEGMSKNTYSEAIVRSSAQKISELARRYRLTVLIIPSRALWVGENRAIEDRVHVELVTALREQHVDTIDLRPMLEKDGRPLDFHFTNDGHWKPRGHALAAEAIVRHIAGNKFEN